MIKNTAAHPKTLYILTLIEGWGRFNYYGTQMILVIYFTEVFLRPKADSLLVYGAFAAFSFALPIFGGLIADKVLGGYRAAVAGALLFILGNLILAFSNFQFFCIGLGINIFGTGLYKSSCTGLVGSLYPANDARRTSGYTIFYMGMNIGATIGPLVYGLAYKYGNWHTAFFITAAGAVACLISLLASNKTLKAAMPAPAEKLLHFKVFKLIHLKYFIYLGILVAAVVFGLPFLYPIVINPLLGLLAVGSILIMLSIALKHHGEERKRIFAILILSIFGMLFFTASLQVGSSLVLFIEHSVHHSIAGWKIPTIMFTALYPLAVIVAAPFISSLWKKLEKLNINPLTPMKLSYGLMLAAIAFIFFALAAYSATTAQPHYWPLVLIVLGNLFLGTGELVLAPAIFTAINVLAPIRLKNTMVGLWFIFVALGAYMSGLLAEFCSGTFQTQSGSYNAAIYTHSYLLIAIGVFALGIILAFLSPAIKRLSCGISLK